MTRFRRRDRFEIKHNIRERTLLALGTFDAASLPFVTANRPKSPG
jgi:hypothetical protein